MRVADIDQVTCQICNKVFTTLAGHVRCRHGVTGAEYQRRFPNSPLVGKSYEQKRTASVAAALTGVPFDEERRLRSAGCQIGMKKPATSRALKGKPKSPEHVRHVAEALMGRKLSAAHRRATSEGRKRRMASDPEFLRLHRVRIAEMRAKSRYSKKNTRIEIAVQSILDELGVPYAAQAKLPQLGIELAGRVVDFALPNLRLVIEADGCYWHGCLECFPDSWDKPRIQRNLLSRRQLVDGLQRIGWSILELWEHDIHGNRDDVRSRIVEAVGG